ncbi:LOW QUALITY PROTEIN: hypothetical protein HZS_3182 [Henneguya salminicola]|nr:LOW QUALITY PROTEIN: hypothetical protein HZS_3182 [Henneguya salminicola]
MYPLGRSNESSTSLRIGHSFFNMRGNFNFISHNFSIIVDMRIFNFESNPTLSFENYTSYSSTEKERIYIVSLCKNKNVQHPININISIQNIKKLIGNTYGSFYGETKYFNFSYKIR